MALDIKDPSGFERLAGRIGDPCHGVAIFLSTAPSLFKPTIDGLEGGAEWNASGDTLYFYADTGNGSRLYSVPFDPAGRS